LIINVCYILEVPFIITNLCVEVFGNSVEALVDKHDADDRAESVEAAVQREAGEIDVPCSFMKDEAEQRHRTSGHHRIDDHRLHVPLQALTCLGADAGHTDADQLHDLAGEDAVEDLEAVEELKDEGGHAVVGGDGKVHHYLNNQNKVDARTEEVVHLLLFTGFFHDDIIG